MDVDTQRVAAFFWIGWEGAVLRAKLSRAPHPGDLRRLVLRRLAALLDCQNHSSVIHFHAQETP